MPALSVSNPHYRVVFYASRAWLSEPFRKGDVLLIALGGKAQSAIKQLVQQSQQFHLAINFDRAAHDALALQESPEMPLGESNCPAQVGKGDPLGGATLTEHIVTRHFWTSKRELAGKGS
jgi:hypothetical protein